MHLKIKKTGRLFKVAFKKWWEKDPFKEGAAIAFYAIFSMPGLLVIIIVIAGYFLGTDVINNRLTSQISLVMGIDTAKQVQDMITIAAESKNSIWATFIGVITILVGATGVFAQFQKTLNIIWEVKADDSKSGVWSLLRSSLFSFGLIVAIAFIMMVSFLVTTMLTAMGEWLSSHFSNSLLVVMEIINFIISSLIIALLFALMFKFFPDAKIKWNHVWFGSIITALLFLSGMYGMSLYFGKAEPGSGYGAAGSIVLILLWVAYSSMIVIYGAEFTHAYAVQKDGYIPPDKNAVKKQGRKA